MRRVPLVDLIILRRGARAAANDWTLLGEGFSGDFKVRELIGAPPIQWRVEAVAESATENRIMLSAYTQGLKVRVRAVWP